MPRFAAGLEYDGRAYAGWQFQPGLNTVQDVVQRALSRVADAPVECVCAGRTDAGVHALAQVVALRHRCRAQRTRLAPRRQHLSTRRRERRLGARSAGALPRALQRRWRAATATSSSIAIRVPALAVGRATWERRPLDAARMHAAAQVLVGEHDFSAFRAIECQAKSPVRRVEQSDGDAQRRLGHASRSPPMPSCITWCATSPGC